MCHEMLNLSFYAVPSIGLTKEWYTSNSDNKSFARLVTDASNNGPGFKMIYKAENCTEFIGEVCKTDKSAGTIS